jgi:spore coat protein A
MGGAVLSPSGLPKFMEAVPVPVVAKPVGSVPSPERKHEQVPLYRIHMRQCELAVHPNVLPTTFWGYDGQFPGPTIEASSGKPIMVEWVNELPAKHLFPIDHTLHGAEPDKPDVRTVVHLHGGRNRPDSDGYPENWFVPGKSTRTYYPNKQEAATLFYHDHAMAITRLNTCAGLFGMFLLRDEMEGSLNLPSGRYEIPLIFCDRTFGLDGQMIYPTSGNPNAPWTSEFYGNAILTNGKLYPYIDVEPRTYRFRILNASNAGLYRFSLSRDNINLVPGSEMFLQIGSDQGLLSEPVSLKSLYVTPGERADLIIDFSQSAGRKLYWKLGTDPALEFRVNEKASSAPVSAPPRVLRPVTRLREQDAVQIRELTLTHHRDARGRATLLLLNGAHWSDPITEKPVLGSTEIWTLINLTDDEHPIHLHLVRFQILDRRRFDFAAYKATGKLVFTGPPVAPEPNEMGWKDTVRADVLMATRIIGKFEGYAGRYVWHCHILEHEDNEMMRPYEIVER